MEMTDELGGGGGVGRRLSDSSRELECGKGVGGLGCSLGWPVEQHTSPLTF